MKNHLTFKHLCICGKQFNKKCCHEGKTDFIDEIWVHITFPTVGIPTVGFSTVHFSACTDFRKFRRCVHFGNVSFLKCMNDEFPTLQISELSTDFRLFRFPPVQISDQPNISGYIEQVLHLVMYGLGCGFQSWFRGAYSEFLICLANHIKVFKSKILGSGCHFYFVSSVILNRACQYRLHLCFFLDVQNRCAAVTLSKEINEVFLNFVEIASC